MIKSNKDAHPFKVSMFEFFEHLWQVNQFFILLEPLLYAGVQWTVKLLSYYHLHIKDAQVSQRCSSFWSGHIWIS